MPTGVEAPLDLETKVLGPGETAAFFVSRDAFLKVEPDKR